METGDPHGSSRKRATSEASLDKEPVKKKGHIDNDGRNVQEDERNSDEDMDWENENSSSNNTPHTPELQLPRTSILRRSKSFPEMNGSLEVDFSFNAKSDSDPCLATSQDSPSALMSSASSDVSLRFDFFEVESSRSRTLSSSTYLSSSPRYSSSSPSSDPSSSPSYTSRHD